ALFLGRTVSLADLGLHGAEDMERHTPDAIATEAVTCQSCGGALELPDLRPIERVVCPYCGPSHDCAQGVLALVAAASRARIEPAIPLGSTGRLDGAQFTVIGFMRRFTTVDGLDYEWDEYLLYEPARGFRWLADSDGHWTLYQPLPPGAITASSGTSIARRGHKAEYNGARYRVFQQDQVRVRYVAGAFYWKVVAGERARTTDYVKPPEMLSAEVTDTEINWSLGRYMPRAELERCFAGARLSLRPPQGVAPNQPFPYRDVYKVWASLLAIGL